MFNVIIMLYAISVDWLKQMALALLAGDQPISGSPAGIEGGAFPVFPAVRGRMSCHSILAILTVVASPLLYAIAPASTAKTPFF